MRGEPRHPRAADRPRRRAARRRGFTLVEMLVSVTLVLMMMLMFAEIYGLAQGTMSTQKGIAENDQKARILTQIIQRDLDTRTFRSVYPFKAELTASFAASDEQVELLGRRRGYFSISENDPDIDTDDVIQFTVEVDQPGYGGAGERHYGKAGASLAAPRDTGSMRSLPTPPASATSTLETEQNHAEYDDGVMGNNAGASDSAEIAYFLRNGNLYRSVLLIRKPYNEDAPVQPTIDTAWAGANPFANYAAFSAQYPTNPGAYPAVAAPPNAPRSVWNDFDYSAYRWPQPAPPVYEWRFHGPSSLSNDPADNAEGVFRPVGGKDLQFSQSLGVPYLRFGHEFGELGRPLEYNGAQFFGRFTSPERAGPLFAYPGNAWAPFDGSIPADSNGDGLYDFGTVARRGVDLMLSNVHSFDVEVWDDIIGDYVDLGHSRDERPNPYLATHPDQFGFYHESRLRNPFPKETLGPGEDLFFDDPAITANFGNRYDTWNPRMYLTAGGRAWRTGRAPYRPQWSNPDPNDPAYNDPASGAYGREPAMVFGMNRLENDGPDADTTTFGAGDPDDSDVEAPLRAVRIVVRYLDVNSGQMRQSTIETSLID